MTSENKQQRELSQVMSNLPVRSCDICSAKLKRGQPITGWVDVRVPSLGPLLQPHICPQHDTDDTSAFLSELGGTWTTTPYTPDAEDEVALQGFVATLAKLAQETPTHNVVKLMGASLSHTARHVREATGDELQELVRVGLAPKL